MVLVAVKKTFKGAADTFKIAKTARAEKPSAHPVRTLLGHYLPSNAFAGPIGRKPYKFETVVEHFHGGI